MHDDVNATVEQDGEWFIAYSPEVAGANGQGHTRDEAITSLREAIALILQDRREAIHLKGVDPGDPSP